MPSWNECRNARPALFAIVKYQPKAFDAEAFISAMWVLFLRAPADPSPNLDGSFSLGEIGETRHKNWERLTPYSVAKPQSD
jgi:hypothetical protein